jgi:hypothetical protein
MSGRVDIGRSAVAALRDGLGIDDAGEHSDGAQGFAWNPFGWEQRVWAVPAFEGGDDPAASVHLRTELSLRLDGSTASMEALRFGLPLATLSGVVRSADDPGRLQLASSLRVRASNEKSWAVRLLAIAARLQLLEAFLLDRLASTPPPGARLPGPGFPGLEPATGISAEVGPDVAECAEALRALPGAHAVRIPGGLTASLPFGQGKEKGLLELVAQSRRPALGPGLSVVLTLPGDGGVAEAVELNEREIEAGSPTDLLGGWSARAGARVFTTFVPMAAWDRGLAVDIVQGFVRRVERLSIGPTSSPS